MKPDRLPNNNLLDSALHHYIKPKISILYALFINEPFNVERQTR